MSAMFKARPLLLLFICSAALITFAILRTRPEGSPDPRAPLRPSEERAYWERQFARMGAHGAYEEFKKITAGQDPERQHLAAHIFGELLYDKERLAGLAVCDSSFGFGCYHSFFGRALTDQGPEVIKRLNDICVEKHGPYGTGCQHGIGHGIMEYAGNDISAALAICPLASQPHPLLGCTSGVFMEYFFPIEVSGSEARTSARKIDPRNPHDPCDSVAQKFRESCYHEIIPLWSASYAVQEMASLCRKIAAPRDRMACAKGIGTALLPRQSFDPERVIGACGELTEADRVFCLAGASWGFFSVPELRTHAGALCSAAGKDKEKCETLTLQHELQFDK